MTIEMTIGYNPTNPDLLGEVLSLAGCRLAGHYFSAKSPMFFHALPNTVHLGGFMPEKICLICGTKREDHDQAECDAIKVALNNKIERSKGKSQ